MDKRVRIRPAPLPTPTIPTCLVSGEEARHFARSNVEQAHGPVGTARCQVVHVRVEADRSHVPPMAGEHAEAVGGVVRGVDVSGAIRTPAGHVVTVYRGPGDAPDRHQVIAPHRQRAAPHHARPQPHGPVRSARDEKLTVGAEGHSMNAARVSE